MRNREVHVVGNWKMNQSLEAISNFFIEMTKMKMELKCKAWVAPQFIHIPILKDVAFTTGMIQVGAQSVSEHNDGAFTGEVSAAALADLGVDFVIIGHSERRTIFGETNTVLNKKVLKALEHNLKVIYCVGETLEEREANKTFEVIKSQLSEGLKDIPEEKMNLVLIAYEPVWAIGTGKTASPEQAQDVHSFIRENIDLDKETTIILYGGSVKPDNFGHLLSQRDIDGALVGGASLKGTDFKQLCTIGSMH